MRVLLVSDTHGVVDDRIAALTRGCDFVVHGGDVGNASVIEALAAGGAEVVAVRGNNDVVSKWPRVERETLDALEAVAYVALPGGVLVATHGDRYSPSTRHAKLRAQFPEARVVVYGHSHRLVVDDRRTPWILNPGAAGKARTYGGPSCLVLEATARKWRVEPHRFERA
jgi:putative phosphoesterase